MAESIQRILVGRTLAGQHPDTPTPLMEWLEAVARGWNARPTPFIWGVSGRSAVNGRANGAMVSVVQEPSLASPFSIKR